ncbi:PEP-CTERM sorting domain-containing protein [Massilia endophytica]|uniref:PEP-CTERM sorting domain-containing protein n=1 Tax=Massilia endophytica TaxID=2899220 RepID=UPI001E5E7E93|nr:PEP-CTERM sorting domain-containing protein [Massilia endophytica]UGQ45500.1 PEP-CTERM sorting domain-containing protein [Massilia endophytica]
MLKMKHKLLAALALAAAQAQAGSAGQLTVDDASLGGTGPAFWSDDTVYSGVNPMRSTSGFAGEFAPTGTGSWTSLERISQSGAIRDQSSTFNFTFAFDNAAHTSGSWTITNATANKVQIDLVLAMHAANGGGSFLFDNQVIDARQTLAGRWKIDWLNDGGNIPGFSNLVLYGRDQRTILAPAPEPETWAMLATGLLAIGLTARRRRKDSVAIRPQM